MDPRPIIGCLLGTAVGDAIGLPYEGLSVRRAARMLGPPERHRFLFGRGMVSDDTEHACMTAQALLASGGDPDRFARELARRLRWWLLGIPGGVGLATLRATLKLWVGVPPRSSGVFSAGNGPAMRAPIIGAAIDDPDRIGALVRASTRITHTDPKAEVAAAAAAHAAWTARHDGVPRAAAFASDLRSRLNGPTAAEFLDLIDAAAASVGRGETTRTFAEALTSRDSVSGYAYHSVPVALHAWLRHGPDFRAVVTGLIECGGDTDTIAAIAGGITGAATGAEGIPRDWVAGILEWPRTVAWMHDLGERLSQLGNGAAAPSRLNAGALLARNIVFDAVVLTHGLRRLLPPY